MWVTIGKIAAMILFGLLWGFLAMPLRAGQEKGSKFIQVLDTLYIIMTLLLVGYGLTTLIRIW